MKNDFQNSKDEFSDLIHQKLIAHKVEPDASDWMDISKRLSSKSNRKLWILYASAASLIFAFSLFFFNSPEISKELVAKVEKKQQHIPSDSILQTQMISTAAEDKEELVETVNTQDVIKEAPAQTPRKKLQYIQKDSISQTQLISTATEDKEELVETGNAQNEIKEVAQAQKDVILQNELVETSEDWVKPTKNSNWVLQAGAASSGVLASNNEAYFSDAMLDANPSFVEDKSLISSTASYIAQPSDFNSRTYDLPLSFAMMAYKSIGKSASVGAGLQFTMLNTKFEDYKWGSMTANLKLYYLGLPLRLNVNLFKINSFNLDFTTGLTVEKGLQSVYTQRLDAFSAEYFTQVKESIAGYQISSMAGAEFNYPVSNHFNLYLSPVIMYYFNNNQPLSIRTEMPMQLSLQMGLKYKL